MSKSRNIIKGSIPVLFIKEGETFVAFSPTLDLSSCGDTFDQAKRHFLEALDIFFEECLKHGTLEQALQSYGWKKSETRPSYWEPPILVGEETLSVSLPAAK